MAGTAAGQQFDIAALTAQEDQRGGVARPHDNRLGRMACPGRFADIVHRGEYE
jgi:hypothetical protein